ncbi:site-specific DNA-methyltransferase [Nocardioides pinisoli]|uniref:Methyltransferase n=1 Tax=Nocardioides pinisoli TaxID=2950279 RepID=A0ABT1KZ95_9ACTN|nr:site-specific DNA-methyltransferase [Nocardioides pinisoli]MCP3423095.1 site-specific DNA-methyltransferase [Nocardioides pinisoli]
MPDASTYPHRGQPWNTLHVGDNLDVLPLLPAGSVDVVYTDPPYNTGNDFAYADRFRDASHTDPYAGRHAAWTAMMRPRLEAVREVLAPHGAVFVSIDDNEAAHLRLLMDEVFGEANFLAQVVVNLNPKGRQLGRGFATSHEYVLAYARDLPSCVVDGSTTEAVDEADFPLTTADGRRFRYLPLRNTNKKFNPVSTPTLHYPLHGDPVTGRVSITEFAGSTALTPVFGDGRPAVWRWSRPRVEERPDDLECRVIRGRGGERADIFQRDWLHREGGRRKKLRTIWLAEEIGSTDTAVAELKALVGHVFESPKPTGLVRRILSTLPSDVVVLDPFAGSGTTGHAVALANAADGGTRRCISINSAEPTREGSNARLAGLDTVADITRARLTAVADRVGGGLEVAEGRSPDIR